MKILVCISNVPDTTSKINFVDNNTKFDTTGVQFIIGPYDDYALARAIELKESTPGTTVTVINIG
jgi:electron transfer flavoprotein beta subunit